MSTRVFPGPIWTQPAPGRRKPRFTRDQIADVAIRIADREGFEELSMRRIADELGAGVMTLYYYVRTKDDLIELMNDALMGEVLLRANELERDWRAALAQIARASFRAFRKHPWAISALRGARFGPNSLAHFEQSLGALAGAPFSIVDRLQVLGIVDDYVYGFVLRAYHDAADIEFIDDKPMRVVLEFLRELLANGSYPNLKAVLHDDESGEQWQHVRRLLGQDSRFERGLDALIDGLARSFAPKRKPTRRRRRRA